MTPKEFALCFAREKDQMVKGYMGNDGSEAATRIAALRLSPAKKRQLRKALDVVLTDAFYTVLLALDGAASIGGKQMAYSLRDEKGRELTGGELEAQAYECLQGSSKPRRRRRKKSSDRSV